MSHVNTNGKYRATAMARTMDAIAARAERDADRAIAAYRLSHIKPWCDKHGFKFLAGMGGWCFYHPTDSDKNIGDHDWQESKLPRLIGESMEAEYPTNPHINSVGSVMEDYTPPGWVDRE